MSKTLSKIFEGKTREQMEQAISNLPSKTKVCRVEAYRKRYITLCVAEGFSKTKAKDKFTKLFSADSQASSSKRLVNKKQRLKKRCSEKGVGYDLSSSQLRELYSTKVCSYTGMIMSDSADEKRCSVTLDRVDNLKGYTFDNVLPVSQVANRLKENLFESDNEKLRMSEQELLNFAQSMFNLRYGKLSFWQRVVKCWYTLKDGV